MAIIRQGTIHKNFNKMDRKVALLKDISDGAYRLYGYLLGLRNGAEFNDTYIMKALGLSPDTLKRRKKELRDAGLIYVDRVGLKNYIMYIGNTQMCAEDVKGFWKTEYPEEFLEEEGSNIINLDREAG